MHMEFRTLIAHAALCCAPALRVAQPVGWYPLVGPQAATQAGFGNAENYSALSSAVHDGFLYVGTINLDTGTEIWRTPDGYTWTKVNIDGFGAAENQASYSMISFKGSLYVATWATPFAAGDTRVWRSSNGTSWVQANSDGFGDLSNAEPWAMVIHDEKLYLGVANYSSGAEVWRTVDGDVWELRSDNGFGDADNVEVSAMAVWDGFLYAATRNYPTGTQVYRNDGSTSWEQVNTDGFGNPNNEAVYAMQVFGGALHAATLNAVSGTEIWSIAAGISWNQTNVSGYGNSNNLWIYAMYADQTELITGTMNYSGAELWRSTRVLPWFEMNEIPTSNFGVGSLTPFKGTLYAGTFASGGLQIWAYPLRFIFSDGFESNSFLMWSDAVP